MLTPVCKSLALTFAAAGILAAANGRDANPAHFNIPLWPAGQVPLAKGDGPLDAPFITAFLPPESKRNGTAAIIAPGGSNIMLMYGGEGMEAAEKMNEWGVACFILTYRLSPRYGEDARVLDGNRAVEIVRERAAEFKIDPKKIGFAGFSAGSSLARSATAASKPSSRADYLVMVYSSGRATPGEDLKSFPPTFLLAAAHDRGPANGNAQLFLEMNRAGTVVEMHTFQKGRHGFGAGTFSDEYSPWMPLLKHFLQIGGFLPMEAKR